MRYGLIVVLIATTCLGIGCQEPLYTPTPDMSPTPSIPPTTQSPDNSSETLPLESDFFLHIDGPQDETVVDTNLIQVSGSTSPDATVTLNGEVVTVDEQGQFVATVELEEGPNAIEIVATDDQGNQDYRILTIIYLP